MSPEELLKTLRDGGLDDEAIKKLLGDTMALVEPAQNPAPEDDEKQERAQAGELLGVTL